MPHRNSNPEFFLSQVSGVIHVGANTGQERDLYSSHNLDVLWLEAIPEVFERLESYIAGFPNQTAKQGLITDQDNQQYEFHIANNDGASSSIFELKRVHEIWPNISYVNTISLKSTTLTSLLERESIRLNKYDALVMDTQGSELLVLKGAESILDGFQFILTEVAYFEAYAGCCQLEEMQEFLSRHGFREHSRHHQAACPSSGNYYDIVYRRT